MKHHSIPGLRFSVLAALVWASVGLAKPAAAPPGSRVENLNRAWKFARGAQTGAQATAFDDTAWQAVRLPHG